MRSSNKTQSRDLEPKKFCNANKNRVEDESTE